MGYLFSRACGGFHANHRWIILCCISLLLLSSASALRVVPGSSCTAACTKANITYGDITCYDQAYSSTVAGRSFKECVTCELDTITLDHNTNQTDLGWALFNLRYSTAWCVFDYPRSKVQQVPTPCNQTCGSIATALETNLLTPNQSHPYDYCQDPSFSFNAAACATCYAKVPNQQLISNFLNTLRTACLSQPPPTEYLPISPAQVFSLTPPTSSGPDVNATSAPPPASSNGSSFRWNAKVAVAISVPVAALLILSLLCLLFYVHRKSRRRRSKKRLTKSSSHRTQRSHRPTNKFPPQKPHNHRKTLSNEPTTDSEKEKTQWTFNRPLTYPAPSVYSTSKDHNNYNRVPYPAPFRTRTTPSPNLTSPNHTESAPQHSPRSRLPSHLTSLSRPQTANSLSPPPLHFSTQKPPPPRQTPPPFKPNPSKPLSPPPLQPIRHSLSPPPLHNSLTTARAAALRPPPPPRGLVSWEQRGIQHARTKSLRDTLRRSGESVAGQGDGTTERVKVAMQVPRDANISEWRGETRTPTPVTEEEEEGRRNREARERDWRRRTGSP
ncbi:MAG: hypothetical protein LQ339_000478 [Xanthoria mediterranea]|nr:MAG: hypothetical protein LQ339_000478 [Xanthoria mediterranea]